MKILVTGGAGYIGSFMTRRLLDGDHSVVVVDSLDRGHRDVIDGRAAFEEGNLLDNDFLKKVFEKYQFDGIIHFAGFIAMGESMQRPDLYFSNNTFATMNLLEEARLAGVKKIIFSSTAGVYGTPSKVPINEDHPKNPENPYGESKLMIERMLAWYQRIHGVSFVALRYFNAAGASLDGRFGERHTPEESHIIPNVMKAALSGSSFKLFGSDYDTPDGTCVRDYIHVLDLVEAHILALERLISKKGGFYYNVGTGKGFSNKEVAQMIKKVSNVDFSIDMVGRRPGDTDSLIAATDKIRKELGFEPKHSDLETIVRSALLFYKTRSL